MQSAMFNSTPTTPARTDLPAVLNNEENRKRDYSSMSADDYRSDTSSPSSDRLVIDDNRLTSGSTNSDSLHQFSNMPPKKRYANMTFNSLTSTGLNNDSIERPIVNSQAKVKLFRCKQCPFVATTKFNFWAHNSSHIKPEKQFICPECPFVSEHKHHLKYHLSSNHLGSKPFKCPKCEYSGVNKAMLASHLKSHSSLRPYKCSECNFACKFYNGLTKHLQKTGHKGSMLSEDSMLNKENAVLSKDERADETKKRASKTFRLQSVVRESLRELPLPKQDEEGNAVPIVSATAYNSFNSISSGYAGFVTPDHFVDSQLVPEVCERSNEFDDQTGPIDYSLRSSLLVQHNEVKVENSIDLMPLPLDLVVLEKAEEHNEKCSFKSSDFEDFVENTHDKNLTTQQIQQQIQKMRAYLDSVWTMEHSYL